MTLIFIQIIKMMYLGKYVYVDWDRSNMISMPSFPEAYFISIFDAFSKDTNATVSPTHGVQGFFSLQNTPVNDMRQLLQKTVGGMRSDVGKGVGN